MISLRSRFVSALVVLVAAGTFAAGCSSDRRRRTVTDPERGRIDLFITDAPPQLDRLRAVNVSIERIDAIGVIDTAVGTPVTAPMFLAPQGQATSIDLLPLRGGQRHQLATGDIPRGVYNAARVYLRDVEVRYDTPFGEESYSTTDGRLTIAGAQPEADLWFFDVELPGGVEVQPGQTTPILIDVDLFESLDVQGDLEAPTAMTFTPIARVRPLTAEFGGSIAGVVRTDRGTTDTQDDQPLANASVTARRDGAVVARTKTDAQGVYVLEGLAAGPYAIEADAPGVEPTQTDVNVNEGQRTTQDLLLAEPQS
ncbi:MAG: carboxypeptidase regulatory-like domain-containing protein [Planctomycetota bacterium]|nr:carboxypeptidase regulatory-like domain-containing protein [Planctomycetota bacterium]